MARRLKRRTKADIFTARGWCLMTGPLNKHNLNIAKLAAKDESRYSLTGIRVSPDETICTDCHQLTPVTTPKVDVEQFPAKDGFKPTRKFEPFALFSRAYPFHCPRALLTPKTRRTFFKRDDLPGSSPSAQVHVARRLARPVSRAPPPRKCCRRGARPPGRSARRCRRRSARLRCASM